MSTCMYIPRCLVVAIILFSSISYGQTPTIGAVEPSTGYPGQIINIRGTNFQAGSKVIFGAAQGRVIDISRQLIEVEVPPGATVRRISVISPNGFTSYHRENFVLSYNGKEGLSSSSFETQIDLPAERGLFDVCVCDIDGDGLNDLIGANSGATSASIFQNVSSPGTLSFARIPLNLSASTLNTACGDLNGDGKPEVIFSEGDDGERIFILVNNSVAGGFSFSLRQINIAGNSTKRIEINDLNRDGKPELIVTDQASNQVSILKNTTTSGNLNFDLTNITNLIIPDAESSAGLIVEDIDGDRRPDIAINQFLRDGGGILIARNTSNGTNIQFSDFELNDVPGTYVNLAIGDIDNDGKADLIGTRFLNGTANIFLNQSTPGSLAWSSPTAVVVNASPWGVELGDLDGDGKIDIVVNSLEESPLALTVLNNKSTPGNVNFDRVDLTVDFINRTAKIGDVDGDGRPDIIFTSVDDNFNNIQASDVSILRNINCIIPILEPEGPIDFCDGNDIQLTTQRVNGATYEWRRNGVLESSGPDPFFDVTVSGDYTVTLLTSGDGCSEISNTVSVNIGASSSLPPVSIMPISPICIGGTLTLTANDVGATDYQWRGPNGFIDNGVSVSLNNFRFVNTGRYFLDVISGTCIVETVSIVVEAVNTPDFSVSQSSQGPFCNGEPVTLSVTPVSANFSYQWFNDEGIVPGATNTTFSPNVSGDYFVEIQDLVNNTCPTVSTESVPVQFVSLPTAGFNIPGTSCVNSLVDFSNTSMVDPNVENVSYWWDFGDGTTSNLENTTHIYRNAGQFEVSLTVSYGGLTCQDQISKNLIIQDGIETEIVANPSSVCEGESAVLSLTDSFISYNWSTGETSETITVTTGGVYEVIVQDNSGCDALVSINLETQEAPEVRIDAEKTTLAPNEQTQVTASGLTSYNWEPAELFDDPTIPNPIVTLPETTVLRVTGQSESGCPGIAEIRVNVQLDAIGDVLKAKNFFSPNDGDNINATWQIENIEQFTQCKVAVYDQTGNLLFDAQPYLNDWDGTSKGRRLSNGVYYYVITCESEIVKSGSITLLR